MWNGLTTWGSMTKFGSGKRRVTPSKAAKGWSSFTASLLRVGRQVGVRVGPRFRGGVERQGGHFLFRRRVGGRGLRRVEPAGEAVAHARRQRVHAQTQVPG